MDGDLSKVKVYNNANGYQDEESISGSSSNVTFENVPLVEGNNLIEVTVYDSGGHTGTDTVTVIYEKPGQPPIADFEGNPTQGCAPLTVQFTDNSTGNPTSWSWTFGDGGTSTEKEPGYTYDNPGKYTVSLTATNQFGSDTETKTDYITALPAPAADFVADATSGYAPLIVQFTDNSTGNPTSWQWDFGDEGSSVEPNPSHTYTSPGTYTVSLTATNDCGSDTETKIDYIEVKPAKKADFTWSPEKPKEGEEVQFTDLSTPQEGIISWSWDFGDENTSTEQNPKHTYTQANNPSQTFSVVLTVEWADGGSDTETKSVEVDDKDPTADFTFAPQHPVAGQEVQFTDQSISHDGIVSWLWDFGDEETSSEKNPKHIYAQGDTYTVSLTINEADGDMNIAHKDITVYHQYGDVSLNDRVTGYDAALVLQHTVKIFTLNEEQQKIADVDCSGEITAWDASLILQYAVGKITEFPCQTGQPPAMANLSEHNIAISLPALSVKPHQTIILPIQLKQDANVISACELTLKVERAACPLNYEAGVLTPTKVMTTDAMKEYTLEYQIKDGKINISLAGAEAIAKSGAFVQVEFAPQSQAMITRVSLENVRLNGKLVPSTAKGTIEVLPPKSALLQNFPNPFNPETWIPYQLKEEAEVVIQIYNIKGELVCTLSIGRKPAGSYLSREKAVFWNGKNQNGEAVANGLYFYTFKAGDFQATRKMILVK